MESETGTALMSAIIRTVSAKNILDDVRVVELSEALAGLLAMLLGDFGADVLKIERPGVGDQSRGWGPPFVGSGRRTFLGRTATNDGR